MKRYLTFFRPKLPIYLVYMFQQVEYNPHKFAKWVWRVQDVSKVMLRQRIVWTLKAKILALIISFFWLFYIVLTGAYFFLSVPIGLFSLLVSPFLLTLLSYLIVLAAWLYIEEPRRSSLIRKATKAFAAHKGVTIAVAGSYGKTSMKELLNTVLSEGRDVAATPGNKNVPVSHAAWVKKLSGDEDILIVEYGEGGPGDIKKLAKLTQPDYAIITGLAPNHLDEYKDLDAVANDLLSVSDFVEPNRLFVNAESHAFNAYEISDYSHYSRTDVLGWKISRTKIGYEGTSFLMKKGKLKIKISSGLLGEHQIGPLAFVAALAERLGLSVDQIEAGIAKTAPFEHRMQPRQQHGAWIIDDTYNGSLEGIRAGIALMKKLPATRKIYVTPGLVDQGIETERVHYEIGKLLGEANPDQVVLMQNSSNHEIIQGLEKMSYKGDLRIQSDPLAYYTNLEHVVASGDLVVMQNDWTDNYS